ncbi:UDP-glucose--hexose-1-phosphate uridylyltransferase [Lutibacter sp. TH_r2]|uniref:UDP-glucose--hexose-1-phosphate uridylyltransferase n=1 Tax=Lutibacter sp. TH_r2 TaxID=3082083 RepID=UPI002953C99D|nr:UDP-glucose--hexose-1-phosphate uridylyltransferase [Lutibacter sp. TH_r2]MDV7187640.1 UDP-glucose--hexose-1-phosphate uridylyltransferase [Lutibacter sp. TH_r2]
MNNDFSSTPHRRYNILTGEYVLVSPHRTKRPWQGKKESASKKEQIKHDPNCYLCAGNTRINGEVNPDYKSTFVFKNDFGALLEDSTPFSYNEGLLKAEDETGICKVICFSPNHSETLPDMEISAIENVISVWQKEYKELGTNPAINHVQIFENKGAIMGCSNPHPHGQVWAQKSIPNEVIKKTQKQQEYFDANQQSLLVDYVKQEIELNERVVFENETFVSVVPFWAVWPYEVMILPKRQIQNIALLTNAEKTDYAEQIKVVTQKYDLLFDCSFPYSSGIHQAPTDKDYNAWHFHMSFYPPLLRSATVKKFMVGYEMFGMPQRDITAEVAAQSLREL